MPSGFKSFLGKSMYNGWMFRKKVAETRRPVLLRVLALLVAASGLLVAAEGIVTGWFLPHVTPFRWEMQFLYGRNPWIQFPQWLAAVCMLVIGLTGLYAGIVLTRARQVGAYCSMILAGALLASGAVLLYAGIRFDGAWLTVAGAVNVGMGAVLLVLLGLCWYTLDPLRLHWAPGP
jgi:hypothetical protein